MKNDPAHPRGHGWMVTRRALLKASLASLAGLSTGPLAPRVGAASRPVTVRFGIVADSHYADKTQGDRYCSQSLDKMAECVELMNEQEVDFLVELGDFKDQDSPAVETRTISYLQAIESVFQRCQRPIYHVLGNHDLDSISKSQFLAYVENTGIAPDLRYYSFDFHGLHFVVLDANYLGDGTDYDHGNFDWRDANVPSFELAWLERDLATTGRPVIVFVHQQLDGEGATVVKNAVDVRRVLEASGKVIAVFQGHHHAGGYSEIHDIHYYTLKAMVTGARPEGNAYAIVEVHQDRGITVSGYRKAVRMEFPARCSVADLNGDCVVDLRDYAIMADEWLNSPSRQAAPSPGSVRRR